MKLIFIILASIFLELNLNCQDKVNGVYSIFVDEFGSEWFGTDKGLLRRIGSEWISYSSTDGPAIINDIKKAPQVKPTLWLATSKGIINFNYDRKRIFNINIYDSIITKFQTKEVSSILFESHGTAFFMTSAGVGEYNDKVWKYYTRLTDVSGNQFTSGGYKNDTVYFGTRGEGVARIVRKADTYSGASSYVKPWSELPSDTVNCILIDRMGNQWYGTNQGLCRHHSGEAKEGWDLYYVKHLSGVKVTSLAEDSEGNIWVGTSGGLVKIGNDARSIRTWNKSDGIASDSVNAIFIEDIKSIWIGTDKGVTNYRNSRFENITLPDFLNVRPFFFQDIQ